MNNEFRVLEKLNDILFHARKIWLICEKFQRDSVDRLSPFVNGSPRINVMMQLPASGFPINQLHTADFNQTMSFSDLKSRRFGVQHHLPHRSHLTISMPLPYALPGGMPYSKHLTSL